MDIFDILRDHKKKLEDAALQRDLVNNVVDKPKVRTKVSEFTNEELEAMSDEDYLKLEQD